MADQGINLFSNYRLKQPNFTALDPTMQGNETIQQATQASGAGYVNNRLNASKDADPLTTLGLTTAIGYGIGQGMDYFGPKCEGKYEQTILGKLGSWGDKFSKDTKVGRFIERGLRKISAGWYKLSKKSSVVYTLRNHSTQPEWQFAKMPFHGLHGFLSMDTHTVLENYTKPIANVENKLLGFIPRPNKNDFSKLEQYGLSEDAIKNFKESLNGKTFMEKANALQVKELELLGASPAQIASKTTLEEMQELAKELKITKKLGFNSVAEFETVMKDVVGHPKEIMQAFERATAGGQDLHISINRGTGSGLIGKIKSHFMGRKVSVSEYLNKYKATLGKGNKSHLGRALPKALGWFTEGCTNRFAGGKLAPFMQAFIFADMAYHTAKAPKGEKGETFAERFVNDFSYFVAMTLGLLGIHKIGGGKYIGTDVAGREAYRAALAAHKAKNKAGEFLSKQAFKDSLKNVNAHLNVKGLKWYQKIWQKAARFINIGNEHGGVWNNPNGKVMNFVRKLASKNIIGVPLRIWLGMAVVTPIFVKATTKIAHAIFGRPTHSVLDEDEEENKDTVQNSEQMQNQQQIPHLDPNALPDTNLIKQTINGQNINTQNGTITNTTTATETVNNPTKDAQGRLQEPVRTYIPSPVSMIQGKDPSVANMALANADRAEQEITDIMASLRKS